MTPAQLAALGRLPNVERRQALSYFQTRVWIGERRQKALVVGVPDYGRQPVDVVSIASGSAPRRGHGPHRRPEREAAAASPATPATRIRIVGVGDRTHSLRSAASAGTSSGARWA